MVRTPKARGKQYKIKNIRTGEYLPGTYKYTEVQQICGIPYDFTCYVRAGSTIGGKWKVAVADEEGELTGWQAEWMKEWDRTRRKFLKLKKRT